VKKIWAGVIVTLGILMVGVFLAPSAEDEAREKQRERRENPLH
jgi:hypothetical protein